MSCWTGREKALSVSDLRCPAQLKICVGLTLFHPHAKLGPVGVVWTGSREGKVALR
jgi:hypothetical protein